MLKYILFLGINICLLNAAKCQTLDTTITYYKYNLLGAYKVLTRDSADFIRVVFPSADVDADLTVNEFYKNGCTKLIGKYDHVYYNDRRNKYEQLVGPCVTYFPTGKRKATMNYADGLIVGDEYEFYPNGKIYCYIKHNWSGRRFNAPEILHWECYDQKGAQICAEGNGNWLLFNDDFKQILAGNVKKGLFEGDWRGATMKADSIKYIYKFKDGNIISGIGYDKDGKAYPFIHDVEAPGYKVSSKNYEVSPFVFVRILKSHLKVPKDINGNKMNLDTAHIAFTIERDGTLTDAEIVGNTEPEIKEALKNAFDKSGVWMPRTYFGLPIRSRIVISYKTLADNPRNVDKRTLKYQETMFGFSPTIGYSY